MKLEDLTAQAVKQHPHDRKKAAEALVPLIIDNGLTEIALQRLSTYLVGTMATSLHFARVGKEMEAAGHKLRAELGGVLKSWSLSSGVSLGNATRVEIRREIEILEATMAGIAARIRFMQAIAARLPSDHVRVCEVVSEVEVAELLKGTAPAFVEVAA